MSTRTYRLAIVGCALSWFLLGMHVPLLHQVVGHGRTPGTPVLVAVAGVAVAALAVLLLLLRTPRPEAA